MTESKDGVHCGGLGRAGCEPCLREQLCPQPLFLEQVVLSAGLLRAPVEQQDTLATEGSACWPRRPQAARL